VTASADGAIWTAPAILQEILQAYGIRTPELRIASNRGEAASAAKAVGFPVAIKVKSPDVVHKTDVGGVKLGLDSEEEAARAFDEIKASVTKALPKARYGQGGQGDQPTQFFDKLLAKLTSLPGIENAGMVPMASTIVGSKAVK
jgi:hypothetical protein